MPVHLYIDTSGEHFQDAPATELAAVLGKAVADVRATPELAAWVVEMAEQDLGGAVLILEGQAGQPCGWLQWTAENLDAGLHGKWPQLPDYSPATQTAEQAMLEELAEAQVGDMRDALQQLDGDWRAAQHTAMQTLQQIERITAARRVLERDLRDLARLRAQQQGGA
jgi:hypothetical protein